MTGFRASPPSPKRSRSGFAQAGAAALAALIGFSGSAAAQPAPGAPVPLGPAVMPPPRETPAAPPRAAPSRTDLPVTVDRLAAVDPDSVGLLGDADGGLGVAMWRDTSRTVAVDLIEALPAPVSSRAMHSLARRLLLTTAAVPAGKSEKASLLSVRVEKLLALGDARAAVDLLHAAPRGGSDARFGQVEVEGLFLANDDAGACARVRGTEPQTSYWQQALAYCLARAGEREKASVTTELMRERGVETMPGYFALVDAVLGDKNAKVDLPAEPTALALSMMRAADRKLPDPLADSKLAAVLRVVALSPNADMATRLAAAERAAAVAALAPAELAEIESAVPFTPDELANAVKVAEAQWGPRARALLARAARGAASPAARADTLGRAFALAREKGDMAALRRALAPALDGFPPGPENLAVAAEAGAALFALGRATEGTAWYGATERAAPNNPEAARAWVVLWPLAQLATKPGSWDPSMVARWRAAQGPAGEVDSERARAMLVFALFEALGQPVPAENWVGLVRGAGTGEAATIPDPAALYALDHVSRAGRRGEAVALSLIVIGSRGPAAANPLALSTALAALSRVGLEADARAIAVEAATGG
jgi:hypothetical protein